MNDLAALTNKTCYEFVVSTQRSTRLIIRGDKDNVKK